MASHIFIKFWNIDASTFASHFLNFKAWLSDERNAIWDNSQGQYRIENTRNRNYPVISGVNSDNMFFINDLKLIYIHTICYDCNNIGVTDVSFDNTAHTPSLDISTGILTMPEYSSDVLKGAQGIQGSQGETIQGTAGHDAEDIQGIQGSIGMQGLQGLQGMTGSRGLDVYNTSETLSIQGIDGTYYNFNGSQRTIITGLYTLQGYLQGIQGTDLSDYVTNTGLSNALQNIDGVKWIDI